MVGISCDDERIYSRIREIRICFIVENVIGESVGADTVINEIIVIRSHKVVVCVFLDVIVESRSAEVEGRCACGFVGKGDVPYAGVDRRGLYDVSFTVLEIYGRFVESRTSFGNSLYTDNKRFGLICGEIKRLLKLRDRIAVIVDVAV